MTTDSQLRGALLEEAILYLLRKSGYNPVLRAAGDPTLQNGSSGLEVKGRGSWHQIDAIADFKLTPPFSNPQRLFIEAKYYADSIGLPIVRNSAGVLKDVSENWVVDTGGTQNIAKKRFHYLSAVFSTSNFTKPAQDYAYAQDIYLLPLRHSMFFLPVIRAIDQVSLDGVEVKPKLKAIRHFVRRELFDDYEPDFDAQLEGIELRGPLLRIVNTCREQSFGFIAMFGAQFPAFLIASPEFNPEQQHQSIVVRIRCRDRNWFIEDINGRQIFSFDLPENIFALYAERGRLGAHTIASIKSDIMREFYAFYNNGEELRLLHFKLDEAWFEAIQRNLRERN
ncbi:MAG: hypothetical protein ABFS18_11585 [Thermodesulfobacteriota bacterium]